MDFITVVFGEELDLLKTQAKSFDLYAPGCVQTIWVVVNDDPAVMQQIDTSWWGKFSPSIQIISRDHLGIPEYGTGWDSQQLCKLVTASLSTAEHAVIFDAKTWLVKQLRRSDFIDPVTEQINVRLNDVQPCFKDGWDYVVDMFGIEDPNIQLGPAGVPYIMHTRLVRSMVNWIADTQPEGDFIAWFMKYNLYPVFVTEFLLYSAWVYKNTKYEMCSQRQTWSCINIARGEESIFNEKYTRMIQPNTLTVSIHRDALTQLTPEQKTKWKDFLNAKGLS